jgi:3-oxoacyl-[acyl-carrier-protein] synthase-1
VRAYSDGHAAAARAFGDALADLRAGVVARAIVCGVDSLIEPTTLRYFLSKRRVKTADHIDGFVPGEAAAALLLEPAAQASARGAQVLAVVEAASTASEPVTIWGDDPPPATGLSEAIRGALAQLTGARAPAQLIVCDLNGETYRAKEFGNAAARALSAIPTQWSLWHPADCIGDTGAAAFAVSACVAARALAKGYAKSERALILGSSDDGLRGAVSLRRVPPVEA